MAATFVGRTSNRRSASPATDVSRYATTTLIGAAAGEFEPIVSAIWTDKNVSAYITAGNLKRHVWHAWLASDFGAQQLLVNSGGELLGHLAGCRNKALLAEAYPDPREGLLSALARLDFRAKGKKFYRDLAQAIGKGGVTAKLVWHSRDLTESQIGMLARLRPEYATQQILDHLLVPFVQPAEVELLCWLLDRLRADLGDDYIRRVLASKRPVGIIRRTLGETPFPAAPWAGTKLLRPVTSQRRLREMAALLRNCLTDEALLWEATSGVLQGGKYFYEWSGNEPALLLARPLVGIGWVVAEADGYQSRGLDPSTIVQIESELATSSDICPSIQPRGMSNILDQLSLA